MTRPRTFPVNYTDDELKQRAAELSKLIVEYNPKTGNAENLIKDSVLFNVTYIELQNRKASRVSNQMILLTWTSAAVALGGLAIAWLTYDAGRSADKGQEQQISVLNQISVELASTRKLVELSLQPKATPVSVTPKSALHLTSQGTATDKPAQRP